jgi:iron uptake system EfeUOB component EfeO/EfeM
MERTMWSDERLDDRFDGLDRTLERIDCDIRELRADIGSLRLAIFQVGGGLGIGLIGVIASILISGT